MERKSGRYWLFLWRVSPFRGQRWRRVLSRSILMRCSVPWLFRPAITKPTVICIIRMGRAWPVMTLAIWQRERMFYPNCLTRRIWRKDPALNRWVRILPAADRELYPLIIWGSRRICAIYLWKEPTGCWPYWSGTMWSAATSAPLSPRWWAGALPRLLSRWLWWWRYSWFWSGIPRKAPGFSWSGKRPAEQVWGPPMPRSRGNRWPWRTSRLPWGLVPGAWNLMRRRRWSPVYGQRFSVRCWDMTGRKIFPTAWNPGRIFFTGTIRTGS